MENCIVRHWLALGYLVLLTGLFWVANGSLFTKFYYGLIAAPALFALILAPHNLRLILREPIVLVFLAFSAWLLLSLSWTQADDGLGGLAKRPLYVFMMFAACALIACKDEQLLLKTLRIGALLAVLAALINLYFHFTTASAGARLIGTGALRNPLLTSHVLGFFCTYWIAAWLTRSERHDWLPILLALPLLVALLATGSRTPLLALTLTSLWMLLITSRRALYLVAALMVAAAISMVFMPELLLQRGLSFRPQLWSEAIRQASEHLWIGHGFDSKFVFNIKGLGWTLSDPHNVELAVLLELGLVGLSLWLLMYGLILLRCLQQRHQGKFQLASALVVYGLSAGLSEGSNFFSRPNENWFLIWIPISLVAALSISQRLQSKP
ncbi:O-antigen ligase family protein [Pseudomonas borbori]|uniref:O-Antigen ligase n=1 Tax=Pseudomonas borbori TaxID=289003 RepID=A0A1I5S4U5_9PSED|nr:O-antigen ligase family protein [Pseudomonas borbori]SFP65687.1 O-Antigen ligase [Pseudomonas borbori]